MSDFYDIIWDIYRRSKDMVKEIDVKSSEQVAKINRLACQAPYSVWLHSKTIMVDARSLLGLYALVGERVHVVAEDDVNPKSFEKLVRNMQA